MARHKDGIFTSLHTPATITTNGIGESRRICLHQDVHEGPAIVKDRHTILVLNAEEAFKLALSLIGLVPAMYFEEMSQRLLDTFNSYAKLINTAERKEE